MASAQLGDLVTVVYDGFLDSGEQFESSAETGPLQFQIGTGGVMAAFEEAVIGMGLEETREVTLEPEQAYGLHHPDLIHTMERSTLNKADTITPGMVLGMTVDKDGEPHQIPATVIKVENEQVTLDFNHPLAGKKIIYKITLQKIARPRNETSSPPAGD